MSKIWEILLSILPLLLLFEWFIFMVINSGLVQKQEKSAFLKKSVTDRYLTFFFSHSIFHKLNYEHS